MRVRFGRSSAIALYLVLVAAFAAGVSWISLRDGLARLGKRGAADLSLASGRLTGELQRYRELAVFFADHPTLLPLALGQSRDAAAADRLLQAAADRTGSDRIEMLDGQARVVASSAGAVKAAIPFLGILFIFLIMVTYIPVLSTWLPNMMMGPETIMK